MADWHGYPQHPDAHPERPWWRLSMRDETWPDDIEEEWVRADGSVCGAHGRTPEEMVALFDRYDASYPLVTPPPLCGQVWVGSKMHQTVIEVFPHDGWVEAFTLAEAYWMGSTTEDIRNHLPWPPPGAVLVAGPGAPWAAMGGEAD